VVDPTRKTNQNRPDLWDQRSQKQAEKCKLEEISAYLSSFLSAAASATEPAQADVALRYEAVTVSVTVTSQMAQRPSFHGVSVRPSGRLPSALKWPCGSLIEEIRLWKVNARSGHSQSDGAVIDPGFV